MICMQHSKVVSRVGERYMPKMRYKQIGLVCCEFYDEDGKPTEKLTNTEQRIASHVAIKEEEKENKKL